MANFWGGETTFRVSVFKEIMQNEPVKRGSIANFHRNGRSVTAVSSHTYSLFKKTSAKIVK